MFFVSIRTRTIKYIFIQRCGSTASFQSRLFFKNGASWDIRIGLIPGSIITTHRFYIMFHTIYSLRLKEWIMGNEASTHEYDGCTTLGYRVRHLYHKVTFVSAYIVYKYSNPLSSYYQFYIYLGIGSTTQFSSIQSRSCIIFWFFSWCKWSIAFWQWD